MTNASKRPREETTKMTSKGKQLEDQDSGPKIDYVELLLSHYTKAEEIIEKAEEFNRKSGLPEELMTAYINYTVPSGKEKYLNWIAECTSEQNGKFWNMNMLRAAAHISDEETERDNVEYPRRELFQLYRVQTSSKKEFLYRMEMWHGLKTDSTERSLYVEDLDYYIEPNISYPYADPGLTYTSFNPRSTESRKTVGLPPGKMRVAKLATNVLYPKNEMGKRVWTTPFSAEAVTQALTYQRGELNDHNNGTALMLKKEGVSNPVTVTTLEDFLNPSFDDIFKRQSSPAESVNVKDLVEQLRSSKASDLEKVQHIQ